jgi:aspartyl-tRNA(Asn)/glutamyl-tRNA(Gln) amidotransferase subunit A
MAGRGTLVEVRAALAAGTLDPVHLVRATLADLGRAEPRLNAFVAVHREAALAAAAAVRDEGAEAAGRLRGVPLAIKDNFDEAGLPSAAGCRAYRDRVPAEDAAAVARLRRAGGVIVGRTNMDELADGTTSENPHHGPVHNPWRHGYHAGGSSGGSAAAVAAGLVAGALGTDTGGSVRIPAALCGVVGFKPSRDLVSTRGVLPLSTTLDHVGTLTRGVADAAALLEVIAERSPGLRDGGVPQVGRLRVGVLEQFGMDADAEVAVALEAALPTFEAAGLTLRPLGLPALAEGGRILTRLYRPEAAAAHGARLHERPDDFGVEVRLDLERGRQADPSKHAAGLAARAALAAQVAAAMADVDLLVCPTTPHAARPHGAPGAGDYLVYTCPFNATGQPAISIPMGFVEGLPVGLQLVGRPGEDAVVLGAAAAVERRLGLAAA